MLRLGSLRSGSGWALVVLVAWYLALETARYHLLGIALPVLILAFVGPAIATLSLAAVRPARLSRSVRWFRICLALFGVGIVLLVAAAFDPMALGYVEALGALVALGAGTGLAADGGVGRATATSALATLAIAAWVAQDLVFFQTEGLRDLRLDLHAGLLFDHGLSPYMTAPLTSIPADQTLLPFVYPPPTLPLLGLLAAAPEELVIFMWVVASLVCAVGALRLFGLSWRWTVVLLLWPAVAQGLYVGNVAVFAAFLFALGHRIGAGLVVAGIAKAQNALPALWLVRERRWRQLIAGLAVVAAICLVTLPFVGVARWSDWVAALEAYSESTARLPGLLGIAMPEYVPVAVWIAAGIAAVAVALRCRGRTGLARLGLASVIASPTLYSHGFFVALPAMLELDSGWFWTAMALTATLAAPGWWIAVGLAVAAWFVAPLRGDRPHDSSLPPLGRSPALQ